MRADRSTILETRKHFLGHAGAAEVDKRSDLGESPKARPLLAVTCTRGSYPPPSQTIRGAGVSRLWA